MIAWVKERLRQIRIWRYRKRQRYNDGCGAHSPYW